jgi:hypothetical protein
MKLPKLIAALTVCASLICPTFAEDVAPLPAGKPAGTNEAALLALGPIFWIGLAAAIAGIAAAASSGSSKTTTTTTTGTGAWSLKSSEI